MSVLLVLTLLGGDKLLSSKLDVVTPWAREEEILRSPTEFYVPWRGFDSFEVNIRSFDMKFPQKFLCTVTRVLVRRFLIGRCFFSWTSTKE